MWWSRENRKIMWIWGRNFPLRLFPGTEEIAFSETHGRIAVEVNSNIYSVSREMMDNECERIKIPLHVLEENKEGVEEGEDKRRFDFSPFWQIGILGRVCESQFQILPFKGLTGILCACKKE